MIKDVTCHWGPCWRQDSVQHAGADGLEMTPARTLTVTALVPTTKKPTKKAVAAVVPATTEPAKKDAAEAPAK